MYMYVCCVVCAHDNTQVQRLREQVRALQVDKQTIQGLLLDSQDEKDVLLRRLDDLSDPHHLRSLSLHSPHPPTIAAARPPRLHIGPDDIHHEKSSDPNRNSDVEVARGTRGARGEEEKQTRGGHGRNSLGEEEEEADHIRPVAAMGPHSPMRFTALSTTDDQKSSQPNSNFYRPSLSLSLSLPRTYFTDITQLI